MRFDAGFVLLALLFGGANARAAETRDAEHAGDTMTVYRHVGADGVVSFSDRASDGAQRIEVPVSSPRPEDVTLAGETLRQQLDVIDVLERSRRADAAERAEQQRLDLEYARIANAREAAEAAMHDDYDDHEHYFFAPWYGAGYRPYPGWPGTCRPGFGACYQPGFPGSGAGGGMPGRPGGRPMPHAPPSMQVKLL